MASFTAADVKKLRELTGAGMMDCKKALDEADGDFDAAIDILRTKGAAKAAKRGAEREASAGLVAHAPGVLVELKCETDFVAKGEDFVVAAQQIADAASQAKPADVEALKAVPLGDQTVGEVVEGLAISIGEKIELGQYVHFDGPVVAYLHKRAADLPVTPVALAVQGIARDKKKDTIDCGKGEDFVVADNKDRLSRCETVKRP